MENEENEGRGERKREWRMKGREDGGGRGGREKRRITIEEKEEEDRESEDG